jgi:hypothetical protein
MEARSRGGFHKIASPLSKSCEVVLMLTASVKCRICKKVVEHHERIVTDNLPDHVAVLECTGCGALGINLVETRPRI